MTPDVIIVGGGIAGSATALRAAQYNLRIAWYLGDRDTARRSRAQWVANIDNMIGLHDGIVRRKMLKRLSGEGWANARARLEHHEHISARDIVQNTRERIDAGYGDRVEYIEEAAVGAARSGAGFAVTGAQTTREAPYLVLATGVMDRQPLIKKARGDEILDQPDWIYPFANRETVLYCIRCEGHLTRDSRTAVIGHGEAAAQLAMMLHERYESACSVLTNGETPVWALRSGDVLDAYGIDVHEARITDVSGTKGQLHLIQLEDGAEVSVQFALVALGLYRVYNDLARQLRAELEDVERPEEERHVLIDHRGRTSVPGLFAVGDMTTLPKGGVMKQVYTSQEYAVRAVDAIDGAIRAARREAVLVR